MRQHIASLNKTITDFSLPEATLPNHEVIGHQDKILFQPASAIRASR